MVMKTQFIRLLGLLFLTSIISCEKSTEADLEALTMELESCKPDKKKLRVGMEYQGGIIFYLDETGKHGLIAAKQDIGQAPWGCNGISIPEAQATKIGDGEANTAAIIANCPEPGIAAKLCKAYEVREKGKHGRKYTDWFLPSLYEFIQIGNILGKNSQLTCNRTYMTSSEGSGEWQAFPVDSRYSIWVVYYGCDPDGKFAGLMLFPAKFKSSTSLAIRPIRAF
jgi:hypothetical protein